MAGASTDESSLAERTAKGKPFATAAAAIDLIIRRGADTIAISWTGRRFASVDITAKAVVEVPSKPFRLDTLRTPCHCSSF